MGIYVDPAIIVLYVLALLGTVWYACGCASIRDWVKCTPSQVDLSFEVIGFKHKQMIFAILDYLNTHKSQFTLKKSLRKSISIPFKEVIALVDRNNVQKFRIESINTTTLFIEITCEYANLRFGCTCDEEVFSSLLRIMRNVHEQEV